MTQAPPPPPPMHAMGHMKPHRGGMILALGILGLVLCFICGIIAWILGSSDMREMDSGVMDPSGRGLTQAGKICGMIATILWGIGILLYLGFFLLVILGAVAGAGAGAGGP